jgi:hypothetical protein
MQPWARAARRQPHTPDARVNLMGSNWPAGSKHDRRLVYARRNGSPSSASVLSGQSSQPSKIPRAAGHT